MSQKQITLSDKTLGEWSKIAQEQGISYGKLQTKFTCEKLKKDEQMREKLHQREIREQNLK